MHSTTRGGKKYFVTFIYDYSKYCYVYLMHAKDELLQSFLTYKKKEENWSDSGIKTLRSDRGGEYYFLVYCECVRIIHETSIASTPQQNEVAGTEK